MEESILSMRLVRGESKHHEFSLDSSVRRAIFRVGCAIECNWQIQAAGVMPHHLMLLWNGRCLTVIDVGAGDLWIDNQAFRLSSVVHNGQISFGDAIISVAQIVRIPSRPPDFDTLVGPMPFDTEID